MPVEHTPLDDGILKGIGGAFLLGWVAYFWSKAKALGRPPAPRPCKCEADIARLVREFDAEKALNRARHEETQETQARHHRILLELLERRAGAAGAD